MELQWRQTSNAWIASLPENAEIPGGELESPVEPAVKDLATRLLSLGGKAVSVPISEWPAFCKTLALLGQVLPGDSIELRKGRERACHANSVALWLGDKVNHRLATGFGLSGDQIWRRHSWVIARDNKIIETTQTREKYFGLLLEDDSAEQFARWYR
jgi:hypothetical protein